MRFIGLNFYVYKIFYKISKLTLYNLKNKLIFKDIVINSIIDSIYFLPYILLLSKLFVQKIITTIC